MSNATDYSDVMMNMPPDGDTTDASNVDRIERNLQLINIWINSIRVQANQVQNAANPQNVPASCKQHFETINTKIKELIDNINNPITINGIQVQGPDPRFARIMGGYFYPSSSSRRSRNRRKRRNKRTRR